MPELDLHVVAYDYGIKHNILRMLTQQGCRVTVVPAKTSAEDVLALNPDGMFLSNGPGDPEPVKYAQENIRRLMGKNPVFGICLGHQLIGMALGGKTYKLKFGHHGGNHPVQHTGSGKVEITAHNHNLRGRSGLAETERSGSDAYRPERQHAGGPAPPYLPLFSVQYHPGSQPRPARFALPLSGFPQNDGGVEEVMLESAIKNWRRIARKNTACDFGPDACKLKVEDARDRLKPGTRRRFGLSTPNRKDGCERKACCWQRKSRSAEDVSTEDSRGL